MSPSFEGLGALREGFPGEAELSQAFFNVTVWTMPHIFLEGKAMVSQKIMGAFLPQCQRREWGSVWGVGVMGFSFLVLFTALLPLLGLSRGPQPQPQPLP